MAHKIGAIPIHFILIRTNFIILKFNLMSHVNECLIAGCFLDLIAETTKNFKYFLWFLTVKCQWHFLFFFIAHLYSESAIRRQARIMTQYFNFSYGRRHKSLILDTYCIIIIFLLWLCRSIVFVVEYLLRISFLLISGCLLFLIDDNGANMHKYHIVPHF